MSEERLIIFENVSKFYGEVLGVNRVSLAVEPGITSLVGPNGAGKTTLMNLMTGLLRPTKGTLRVLGIPPSDAERFYKNVGYCSQFDAYPKGLSGYDLLFSLLCVHGMGKTQADEIAWKMIERVGLTEAAKRKIAAYSKGMRQRIKLAIAIAHEPQVLVLDEPLNGLDPMARSEVTELFRTLAASGMHVIISSHILHEVDRISDQVILLNSGYVVAEGQIQGVRDEVKEHPMQIMVRCSRPGFLAAKLFAEDHIMEAKLHDDGRGILIRTRDAGRFYSQLHQIVLDGEMELEAVAPADYDVNSVYQYLIGSEGATV